MPRFAVFLVRPVTVTSVVEAMNVKVLETMKALMKLDVFANPDSELSEDILERLGEATGVDFKYDDNDGGDGSVRCVRPLGPTPPPPLQERAEALERSAEG